MKTVTIVKVMGRDGNVTQLDIDRWRDLFSEKKISVEQAAASGEVQISQFSFPENVDDNYITFIKLGGRGYRPTAADLTAWRELFIDAVGAPDYKIFTAGAIEVDISRVKIADIIAVE